jgi:hypothetical protein
MWRRVTAHSARSAGGVREHRREEPRARAEAEQRLLHAVYFYALGRAYPFRTSPRDDASRGEQARPSGATGVWGGGRPGLLATRREAGARTEELTGSAGSTRGS